MLEQGDRITFSNKPTSMERPLPSSVDEILTKYAAEQNYWADAASALHGTPENEGGSRFAGDPLDDTQLVSQPPDRLLLIAHRSNSSAPVNFTLYIIANGVAIGTSNVWLGSDALRQVSKQRLRSPRMANTQDSLSAPDSKAMYRCNPRDLASQTFHQPQARRRSLHELLTHPEPQRSPLVGDLRRVDVDRTRTPRKPDSVRSRRACRVQF